MPVSDTAIGAILEIPLCAMQKITAAQRAIDSLAKHSYDAANAVKTHWGVTAGQGLETFIEKLVRAKEAMNGLGTVNVTLNTGAAVQAGEQLSTQMQKTSNDVAKAAQDMAQLDWSRLAKVDISKVDLVELNTLEKLRAELERIKALRENTDKDRSVPGLGTPQDMTNYIRQLEEVIRLWQLSATEKNRAVSNIAQKQQNEKDKAYLDEQKRLLDRILQLRKDISQISISVQRGTITGKADMSADLAQLEQLRKELRETGWAYRDLRTFQSQTISEDAKIKAEIQSQNAKNAGLRQEFDERKKLNAAITRANELTAQGQQGKSRLGRDEEASIQRQLNSNYKNQLAILKEIGEIKAKAAEQGKTLTINSSEVQLIQALAQRYRVYAEDVNRVTNAYRAMGEAAAKNFAADRSTQLARNAIMLADAQNKAASQQDKKDRSQAESDLNRLYTERLRLLKEKEQLENKSLINQAKGGTGLTAKENQLLSELTAKLQSVDSQINRIGQNYVDLALKAKNAYALDELRQATQLQTQFNKAIDSIDTSKAKRLTAEYKRLYDEYQKLNASLDQYNSKIAGQSYSTGTQVPTQNAQDIANRMADVSTRMSEIERKNIQEVADFRLQKEMEANQKSISDFIQTEAQKKAAALQTAQEESNARKQALQTYLQSYQGAMQQADKIMSGRGGTSMFATNIENIKRAINDLKAASGNLNLLNPADVQKAEQLKKKIAELEVLLKKYKDAATPDKPVISPQDAINAAKNATTLKQLEEAYKQLKTVMANMAQGAGWNKMNKLLGQTKKQIDGIKKKMGEFHNETQRTSNMMGQLQSRIAAAFSVSAIVGFAKKVTEVRAQFELQRVALGAIIQDADEANKIFLKIQSMALESPFSIMQLERSTKQIAAFGFEVKQLVPMMKMVADIGAGLGVELDRIVLVLGHLKARGYLEGTMVRQFTNMGFNVLGELAKYYTELEGRMVSVADVQDRVKKKMVEFGDVEEVLKRVTSAGGMFYDMQKKQSDSIWGQMQRITDAYDLMLNEIGQHNEASIKAALTAIRSLINSWRTLLPIIQSVGAAMMMYFARVSWGPMLTGLAKATTGFKVLAVMIHNANAAQKMFNASQMASGWGVLLAVIAAVGVAIYNVITYQSKLNEELERTQSEGISDMYGLIFQYRQLADTVKDSTKPYEERKKALEEIGRVYKDILPDYMTEVEYIKSATDGYTEATDAIKAYSEAKIRKNMQETVENEYGQELQKAISSTSKDFATVIKISGILPDDMEQRTIQGAISNIMMSIVEEVKAGTIKQEEVNKEFKERFKTTFNLSDKDISSTLSLRRWFDKWDEQLQSVLSDMQAKFGEVTTLGLTSTMINEDAQPAIDQYHNLEKAVSEYMSALEALYKRKAELEKQGGTFGTVGVGEVNGEQTLTFPGADSITQDAMDEVYNKLGLLQSQVGAYGEMFVVTTQDINRALQSNMDQTEYMGTVNQYVLQNILNKFNKWGGVLANNKFMHNFVESALKDLNLLTDPQRNIINIARKVATANGVAMSSFDLLKISAAANYTDAAKEAKKLSDQAADNIKKITTTRIELIKLGWGASVAQQQAEQMWGGGKTEEELKSDQKAYEQLWKALGGYEKSSKKSRQLTDKELKRWQDLKKAIEDVSTAYDKARKSFSVEESNRQIEALFGNTFRELGANIKDFYKNGTYDAKSLIDALEVLLGMTNATTEERKKFRSEMQRKIANTQVEIDVKIREESEDKLKKDLEKLFDNYELTKTLKDANIDVNLAFSVGGTPTSLEDLKKELKEGLEAAGGTNAPENIVKIYKDAEKKLTDIIVKGQKDRLKNYEKYLATSYTDAAKIQLDYFTNVNKMQKDFLKSQGDLLVRYNDPSTTDEEKEQIEHLLEVLPDQAKRAGEKMREEMQKQLDKLTLENIFKSSLFSEMFQDLGNMTNKALDMMKGKIAEIQKSANNLNLSQVRQLSQYLEKIENAKIDNSPFIEGAKAIQKAYALRAKGITAKKASDALAMSEEELMRLEKAYDDLSLIQGIVEKTYVLEGNKVKVGEEYITLSEELLEVLEAANKSQSGAVKFVQKYKNLLKDCIKDQEGIVKVNAENVATFEIANSATQKFGDALQAAAKAGVEGMGALKAGLELFGEEIDESDEVWYDFVENVISSLIILGIAITALGVKINASLGIIGIIATALQVVAALFKAILGAHDAKLNEQIEDVQKRVDNLSDSFDRLEKAMNKAFDFDIYNQFYKNAEANIEKQKQAYNQMIALEKDKKKSDSDKIDEWNKKIAELNESLEELREKRIEAMGSTTDYLGQASDFVDAWLDAFREVGNGTDALKDSWDEFIDNLVVKQAAAAIVSKRMQKLIAVINDAIDKDMTGLSLANYVKQATAQWKAEAGDMNEALKAFFDAFGINMGNGEAVLSDLQKGIQNITEPQAAAIEAYLNSMRFAVFRHTEQLDMLIASVQAQYGAAADNPIVTELKGIRTVLDNIDRRFASVVQNRPAGGNALKVCG